MILSWLSRLEQRLHRGAQGTEPVHPSRPFPLLALGADEAEELAEAA